MQQLINSISYFILIYFFLLNASYMILFFIAYFGILKYKKNLRMNDYMTVYHSKLTPPISLIVPAYNEEATIITNLKAFLNEFDYPEYEVIVVNDGSVDKTLQLILDEFKCHPYDYPVRPLIKTSPIKNIYRSSLDKKLIVVDKINGKGKSDANNAGINVARYPYFGCIDADTILEPSSFLKLMVPIVNSTENIIAAGGIVGAINGCTIVNNRIVDVSFPTNYLAKYQVLEYLRSFLYGRYAWNLINAMPLISGAFGLFKKDAVVKVGGYHSSINTEDEKGAIGEDIDLTLRLHRYHLENNIPYNILYVPDPLSWTQVPEDFASLNGQRARWHKGLTQSLIKNKDMFFNKKYKKLGVITLPYYFIFEFLAPIIEFYGYISFPILFFTKKIDIKTFILFLLIVFGFGLLVSVFAVFLEVITFNRYKKGKDLFKLFFCAFTENIGYKQLTLYFRIDGLIQYIFKNDSWGTMKRKAL